MIRVFAVLALLMSVGCSDSSAVGSSDDNGNPLEPPAAQQGVQLKMTSALKAGVETERCMFYQVGDDDLAVNREEVRFTHGSHHILLFVTPYESIPTEDRFGTTVDTSGVFECGQEGPTAHWTVNGVAGGSQIANGTPVVDDLPPGVAFVIPARTVLLMNTHYLNATDATIQTDARINLYTLDRSEVQQEAGILFWYNPIIYAPSGQTSRAQEVCPIRKDINLLNAQSHMHKRGVGYVAKERDAMGVEQGELYSTTEWEEVELRRFSPSRPLKAGQTVDFACDYDNRTDHDIIQGLATTDEMCMFIGLYYPKDRQTELCGLNSEWSGAFWAATWIGQGVSSGAQTASCLANASTVTTDDGASFFKCVVESCGAISQHVSNAARCLATQGLGACKTPCSTDAESCSSCVNEQCSSAMSTLSQATCS